MNKPVITFLLSLLFCPVGYSTIEITDSDYLTVSDDAGLRLTNWTITAWVNIDDFRTSTNDDGSIVSKGSPASERNYIFRAFNDGSGGGTNNEFLCYFNGSNIARQSNYNTDQWYHVGCVYNSTNLILYVDGTSAHSIGETGTPPTSNDAVLIGKNSWSSDYIDGEISEVALWNTALTGDQIALLASARTKRLPLQISPSNLMFYLPLDDYPEGHGTLGSTTFRDLSGNGRDATGTDANNNSDITAEQVLSYP